MTVTAPPIAPPIAADKLAAMRADWAADDARIAAALDDMRARTAGVLAAPGLPAPTAALARAVDDLLVLLRAEIPVDDAGTES